MTRSRKKIAMCETSHLPIQICKNPYYWAELDLLFSLQCIKTDFLQILSTLPIETHPTRLGRQVQRSKSPRHASKDDRRTRPRKQAAPLEQAKYSDSSLLHSYFYRISNKVSLHGEKKEIKESLCLFDSFFGATGSWDGGGHEGVLQREKAIVQ